MGARFVIIGMTPGAVGLVGRRGPNNRLGITLMALDASYARIMVSGIAGRGVIEIYSQPVRCVVTFITLQAGHKMSGRLSGRGGSIVTGRTTPRHQAVIHGSRGPGQSAVATVTLS